MKKVFLFIGTIGLFFSISALAEEDGTRAPGAGPNYAFGGGFLTFDDGQDTISPTQLVARIGYDINENFGVGGEIGFSLLKDSIGNVDFDVTTTFLYLKGGIPIQEDAKIYAMIGSTNTKLTGSASVGGITASASADDNDTGFGFGFEKSFGRNGFAVDYVKYNDNEGVDVHSINLLYTGRF
jgi:opacity protein-like surface antigen